MESWGGCAGAQERSQVRDEYGMSTIAMPDAWTQRTCEAVLCERCVIGDEKRILGSHRV